MWYPEAKGFAIPWQSPSSLSCLHTEASTQQSLENTSKAAWLSCEVSQLCLWLYCWVESSAHNNGLGRRSQTEPPLGKLGNGVMSRNSITDIHGPESEAQSSQLCPCSTETLRYPLPFQIFPLHKSSSCVHLYLLRSCGYWTPFCNFFSECTIPYDRSLVCQNPRVLDWKQDSSKRFFKKVSFLRLTTLCVLGRSNSRNPWEDLRTDNCWTSLCLHACVL